MDARMLDVTTGVVSLVVFIIALSTLFPILPLIVPSSIRRIISTRLSGVPTGLMT
jgi:hypothetical protein